ncbi:hypothetical protein PUN28_016864 [Cardiocondyla obscurior]|uniref:Uncharacterized protein n=1 Tax=Cardiocondyla obscurior TaxID=286306 RepID=A0AAW2ESS4_9HYME
MKSTDRDNFMYAVLIASFFHEYKRKEKNTATLFHNFSQEINVRDDLKIVHKDKVHKREKANNKKYTHKSGLYATQRARRLPSCCASLASARGW